MKWRNRPPLLSDELLRLEGLNAHELLSIAADAGADDIQCAYRKIVKVYHPDKADPFMRIHNEQVIKVINAAYARLMSRYKGDK